MVPFLDLKAGYLEIKDELDAAYRRVMDSGHYIMGGELEAFESEFASYCGTSFCIGVGNGLEALSLALRAYDVGEGDEVIVPAHTFIATWLAVSMQGATPVPVPCSESTYNIDPNLIEASVSPRTKAIIPVHLYGQAADMDMINAVAAKYGLFVLEDAAQAQGSRYKGKTCGALGNAAATSFYPGKNLGCYGDGGAVLINDPVTADRIRTLRNYGSSKKYHHSVMGVNSRLDEMQAAFLRVRLTYLDLWNERRKKIAAKYNLAFASSDVVAPFVLSSCDPVWHLYVIRSKQRDLLQSRLADRGIQTLIHYPVPPHEQQCYAGLRIAEDQSAATKIGKEVLSLPISPFMTESQSDEVIDAVLQSVRCL